jgi:hypothetical protein
MPAMSSREKYYDDLVDRVRDKRDPFEVIDTPIGKMEAWRADTLYTGGISGLDACLQDTLARFDQVRADTANFVTTLQEREQQVSAREDAVARRERAVLDLVGGASALLDRLERYRSDQEKFAEEPATPPGDITSDSDPSGSHGNTDPAPGTDPAREADDIVPQAALPADHLEEEYLDPEELEDPEATEDEWLPPALANLEGNKPPEPRGSVFPSPVAISLNAQEED